MVHARLQMKRSWIKYKTYQLFYFYYCDHKACKILQERQASFVIEFQYLKWQNNLTDVGLNPSEFFICNPVNILHRTEADLVQHSLVEVSLVPSPQLLQMVLLARLVHCRLKHLSGDHQVVGLRQAEGLQFRSFAFGRHCSLLAQIRLLSCHQNSNIYITKILLRWLTRKLSNHWHLLALAWVVARCMMECMACSVELQKYFF